MDPECLEIDQIEDVLIFRNGSELELEIISNNLIIRNNFILYIPEEHAALLDIRTSAGEKIKVLHKDIERIISNLEKTETQTNFF